MDIETFREYCLSLPGTTEDVKWGDNLCFMIEGKIYLMCSLTPPHHFNFKIEPEAFDVLVTRPGMLQAPYSAKRLWIAAESLEVLPDQEIKDRVAHSRSLILSKLSKKIQEKYR